MKHSIRSTRDADGHMTSSTDADQPDAAGERRRPLHCRGGSVPPVGDGEIRTRSSEVNITSGFSTEKLPVFLQDEAPVDSNAEDQTSGDALGPEPQSPVLETKQVPSPLV